MLIFVVIALVFLLLAALEVRQYITIQHLRRELEELREKCEKK